MDKALFSLRHFWVIGIQAEIVYERKSGSTHEQKIAEKTKYTLGDSYA
jgi:hypothetical protein